MGLIDQYITDHQLKETEFAAQVGISQPYANRLRKRKQIPSATVARKIEEKTGIPAGELLLEDRAA